MATEWWLNRELASLHVDAPLFARSTFSSDKRLERERSRTVVLSFGLCLES